MTTAVQKREDRNTLEEILKRPAYAERFKQVLGEKASQFCSSLVSIGRSMPDVEPKSIVGSAMIAACLDLPIEKNLGFAWIVPYKKGDQKLAQFQMGYKGYVQLAQRTGYYAGMNACPINKEAYKGRDNLGEPLIDWDLVDETKPAIGYFFGFKMINGFIKGCYWSLEKVKAHAQRYSQSYRSGFDSPWKTHFDKMALKTVIANELSDWGILSVQFQLARKNDQAVVKDIDAEAEYIDTDGEVGQISNGEKKEDKHKPEPTGHQKATQGKSDGSPGEVKGKEPVTTAVTPAKTAEPQSDGKAREEANLAAQNAPAASQTSQEPPAAVSTPSEPQTQQATPAATQEPAKSEPVTSTEPQKEPDPAFAPKDGDSESVASLKIVATNCRVEMEPLMAYLRHKKLAREGQKLWELAEAKLLAISRHLPSWMPEIEKGK